MATQLRVRRGRLLLLYAVGRQLFKPLAGLLVFGATADGRPARHVRAAFGAGAGANAGAG
jgi:hypothetical protein